MTNAIVTDQSTSQLASQMSKPTATTNPAMSSRNTEPICQYFRPFTTTEGIGGGRYGSARERRKGG